MGKYVAPTRPADGFSLTRRYGDRSACFIYNGVRICPPHTGDDYARGTRGGIVVAQHRGRIVYKGGVGDKIAEHPQGMGGYGVIVDFGGGFRQLVAHLVWNSCPLAVGATVEPGTAIGTIDSSGTSSGDHLHNELLKDGRPIDPAPYRAAGALPIADPRGDDVLAVTGVSHIHNRKTTIAGVRSAMFRSAPRRAETTELHVFPEGEILYPFAECDGEVVGGDGRWYLCTMWVPGLGKSTVGTFHRSVCGPLVAVEKVDATATKRIGAAAQHFQAAAEHGAAAAESQNAANRSLAAGVAALKG